MVAKKGREVRVRDIQHFLAVIQSVTYMVEIRSSSLALTTPYRRAAHSDEMALPTRKRSGVSLRTVLDALLVVSLRRLQMRPMVEEALKT